MSTNKVTPSNAAVWSEIDQATGATTQTAASQLGHLGAVDIGDGQYSTMPLYSGGANRIAEIDTGQLQQPIPESGVTSIDGIKFEVAYNGTAPSSFYYVPDDIAAPSGSNPGYAEVQIKISTPVLSSCYMLLPIGSGGITDPQHNGNNLGLDPFADPARVDPTNSNETIDLTNGCPITNGLNHTAGTGTGANPLFIKATGLFAPSGTTCDQAHFSLAQCGAFGGWTGTMIDSMGANFFAETQGTTTPANNVNVGLDGMQYVVTYHGPPAPNFPNGCDSSLPGVQFVFGGDARVDWGQGSRDFFGELCASSQDMFPNWDNDPTCAASTYVGDPGVDPTQNKACNFTGVPNGHNYGIAVYGLSDGTAPVQSTTASTAQQPVPQVLPSDQMAASGACTGAICGNATDTTAAWVNASNLPANYYKAGDNTAIVSSPWNGTADQTLAYNFPTGLVYKRASVATWPAGCPANTIPEGSFITNVQFTATYHEGDWNGTTWMPGWTSTSAFVPDLCLSMHINHSGGAAVGSNGYISSDWDSVNNFPCASNGPGMARCTKGGGAAAGTYSSSIANPANHPPDCTLTYGAMNSANDTQTNGANADNVNYPSTLASEETVWPMERDLTDALASPEGIAGAEVKFILHATASGAGYSHQAAIDGLVFKISYRAPGDPRPARGCETNRTEWPPGVIVPPYTAAPYSVGSPDITRADPNYDWLDADWGSKPAGNTSSLQTDQPFQDTAGSNAGNGFNDNSQDCAIFGFDTTGSGGSPQSKLHIQGMIYTPSGALYLTGNDNDAPWVTDGLTARQITAFKWSKGGGIPSVGGSAPPKSPRTAIIEIRDATGAQVLLRAQVTFNDDWSNWPDVVYGNTVTVNSWVRNPTS